MDTAKKSKLKKISPIYTMALPVNRWIVSNGISLCCIRHNVGTEEAAYKIVNVFLDPIWRKHKKISAYYFLVQGDDNRCWYVYCSPDNRYLPHSPLAVLHYFRNCSPDSLKPFDPDTFKAGMIHRIFRWRQAIISTDLSMGDGGDDSTSRRST